MNSGFEGGFALDRVTSVIDSERNRELFNG